MSFSLYSRILTNAAQDASSNVMAGPLALTVTSGTSLATMCQCTFLSSHFRLYRRSKTMPDLHKTNGAPYSEINRTRSCVSPCDKELNISIVSSPNWHLMLGFTNL